MNSDTLRKRTIFVIIITILMMCAEIYFGFVTHSMALLSDGFHMGTHVIAFLITLIVCFIAVKYEDKTEKLNALGGYTGAIILGLTSLGIIWESAEKFFNPAIISFSDAILVAGLGLGINLLCMIIMGGNNPFHNHTHCHCEGHDHIHTSNHEHENLNFKAAYMHIIADAITSILAIFSLLLGKYFGWVILDPVIGILGGIIIAKWSIDLLKCSGKILLDFE